jgi:hypothetical protein
MKLHIECLQEKLDQTTKEMETAKTEHENEVAKLNEEKKKYV